MQHKVKLTVLDKKVYPELQREYCIDPDAGPCPMYEVGDEFIFERYLEKDDFWRMGCGKQCSEAWDAIARYIYTGLQGGSIMGNWMDDERVMICCCSDGTRPVIFKIERIDYKVLYIDGLNNENDKEKIKEALFGFNDVIDVEFKEDFTELIVDKDIEDKLLINLINDEGDYSLSKID